jgi:large subunit ribosomal protein L10e
MDLRARNYRPIKRMPYTRKEYIGGVPGLRIVKFTMGNPNREFEYVVELLNLKDAQIRHNALEAARLAANRYLERNLGRENYLLQIVPYPHHVLRHKRRLAVAQADRFQDGMRRPYGKPAGTAARVKRGQRLMVVRVDEEAVRVAKEALRRASAKFPIPCRIKITPKSAAQSPS